MQPFLFLIASSVLHGLIYVVIPPEGTPISARESLNEVEMAVVTEPIPEPAEEPPLEEQAPEEPPQVQPDPPPVPVRPRVPSSKPTKEPPSQVAETPVNFDNVTLTNEGDSSWKTEQSSGVSREGPIGGVGAVTGRSREGSNVGSLDGSGSGGLRGPRVVAIGSLSRKPKPPNLNAALERLYPKRARLQGVEGQVKVRARINPDGTVGRVALASESIKGYEFAAACRELLQGSRWTPPLDATGKPVATDITYTCEFLVR